MSSLQSPPPELEAEEAGTALRLRRHQHRDLILVSYFDLWGEGNPINKLTKVKLCNVMNS